MTDVIEDGDEEVYNEVLEFLQSIQQRRQRILHNNNNVSVRQPYRVRFSPNSVRGNIRRARSDTNFRPILICMVTFPAELPNF